DEDRWRDGAVTESFTGGPGADELAHQSPLRAARILEFVDEDMLVSRFKPVAAARELLHLAEQLQRSLEQIRKIEDAVFVERASIFVLRDRKQSPHAARQHEIDVALEHVDRRLQVRTEAVDDHLVALVVGRRSEFGLGVERTLAHVAL